MDVINEKLEHFETLQKIGLKTFGEKFWKSEILLLKTLKDETK